SSQTNCIIYYHFFSLSFPSSFIFILFFPLYLLKESSNHYVTPLTFFIRSFSFLLSPLPFFSSWPLIYFLLQYLLPFHPTSNWIESNCPIHHLIFFVRFHWVELFHFFVFVFF